MLSTCLYSQPYAASCHLAVIYRMREVPSLPHLSLHCAFNILEFSRGYGGNTDLCCPSSEECLLIVFGNEIMDTLAFWDAGGVRKPVDVIKESGNKYAEFGMLGKRSVPRLDDILKAFCSSSR